MNKNVSMSLHVKRVAGGYCETADGRCDGDGKRPMSRRGRRGPVGPVDGREGRRERESVGEVVRRCCGFSTQREAGEVRKCVRKEKREKRKERGAATTPCEKEGVREWRQRATSMWHKGALGGGDGI